MKYFKNSLFVLALFILVNFATPVSTSCGDDTFMSSEDTSALKISQARKFDSVSAVNNVVNSINQFAFDLYPALKNKEENIFFSPYSLSTAMAMTYEGARGKPLKK